jgi:hypothetical protein
MFRKPKTSCFHSYVEYSFNTNTGNTKYTYKYVQNMYVKVGLVEKTKEKEKKERKLTNNNEIHLI